MKTMTSSLVPACIALVLIIAPELVQCFAGKQSPRVFLSQRQTLLPTIRSRPILFAQPYGPPLDDLEENFRERRQEDFIQQQKIEFQSLLDKVLSAQKPEHVPSLLAKNAQLILSMQGDTAAEIVASALEEAKTATNGNEEEYQRVEEAMDMILSFTEEFVEQSQALDDANKKLLGKIIRTMASKEGTARDREDILDELMAQERDNFSRGFLRHLDGECQRIATAPKMTPESARLLEILRVIQVRILEEMGKELGEGALVLNQLIAYEDKSERLAVLDAGLTVRGTDFAKEMAALTEEALGGFKNVPGGVDQELVQRLSEIDDRIKRYLEQSNKF